MRGGEQESLSYKEESYKLDVNVNGNLIATTMFTYDEDHNFSGFWFYKDNDNVSYVVNEKGEIISSNSVGFSLGNGIFVRRINLNEGEIGKTQNVKNEERIICIAEKVTVDGVSILYNENTLEIMKCSDENKNYVGKYYVEFSDSKGDESQLIVNSNLSGISYSNKSVYTVVVDNTENETTGINFNIIVNNDVNKIVYAYRSRDIIEGEFANKDGNGNIMSGMYNITLLAIHLTTGVKKIGKNAFRGCTGLTQVTIPNSVTTIGDYAFINCIGLTQITIPNSVESIGDSAFNYCTGLTQVTIPNSITQIGNNAFQNCTSLKQVTIPNSITQIGDYAFNGCYRLTRVVINGALTSIGSKAFNTNSTLTIYCDDEHTKTLIETDANKWSYHVSVLSLDNYYAKINN